MRKGIGAFCLTGATGGVSMRRIDESERPMPEINPAKVCFIIEKAREYLGEDVGVAPDDSNPTDDDERVMLTEGAGPSIRRELIEFMRDLDVDEAAALVALAWIGRGDFEPEEWRTAVAEAKLRAEGPTWKYLLGLELLPEMYQVRIHGPCGGVILVTPNILE